MKLEAFSGLIEQLKAYKRKFYFNRLIRGAILSSALMLTAFLILNSLEYGLRFNSLTRTFLFFGIVVLSSFILVRFVIDPLIKIYYNKPQMSHEEAARQIGKYFPEVKDKLLNTIQLYKISDQENQLILASIIQKSMEISLVSFPKAIDLGENIKYLKYVAGPGLVVLALLLFIPQFITESSSRLIQFNKDFVPQAPFSFVLENSDLKAFKNEDYILKLRLDGKVIPGIAYLNSQGRRIKMKVLETGVFEYLIPKIQYETDFRFEAAGFYSVKYRMDLVNRPNLKNFNVDLLYPNYISRKKERLENVGNLQVPEGTRIQWHFNTFKADSLWLLFGNDPNPVYLQITDNQTFTYEKDAQSTTDYTIKLKNEHSYNKEDIRYHIEVIKDQYPTIRLEQYKDTTLFKYIFLGGDVSDDHGLSSLRLFYRRPDSNSDQEFQSILISIDKKRNTQSYFHQWNLKDFNLSQGENLEYYLQVWDNDGFNGRKSTRTATYTFHIPTKKEVNLDLEKSSQAARDQINKSLEEVKNLKERIEKAEERLRGKTELNWQDQKLLEQLIKDRAELNKEIEKLKEKHQEYSQKRERFNQQDEKIRVKTEQLQQLMDELLDEETKKLYEELQKLLEDQKNISNIQDLLEKLNSQEYNLEKELERTIELFKRMKFEYKLEEVINELIEVAEDQENLSQESQDKEKSVEELMENQEDLNQEFQDLKEEIDELEELNQDLKNPEPVHDTSEEEENIDQEQQRSQEFLEKNKRKKAQQSQKNASDGMKKLSQQLMQMQSNMATMELQVNLEHLRDIVDNLVKLSFDQEYLMKEFRKVNQSDPRFVELSQKQLKIKDDSKIVEDSLLALANRVFQIQSFITREVSGMNDNIDASLKAIKDRKLSQITSKQQFAMTSINNLAIMLDDVLQQMQQQMADAMGKPQKSGDPKNRAVPSLTELQQQLNHLLFSTVFERALQTGDLTGLLF